MEGLFDSFITSSTQERFIPSAHLLMIYFVMWQILTPSLEMPWWKEENLASHNL